MRKVWSFLKWAWQAFVTDELRKESLGSQVLTLAIIVLAIMALVAAIALFFCERGPEQIPASEMMQQRDYYEQMHRLHPYEKVGARASPVRFERC